MNELENELKKILRRREPPEGFTDSVLHRIDASSQKEILFRPKWPLRPPLGYWIGAAAAAALLLTAGLWQQHNREKEKGLQAKAQVIMALRLTSSKLNYVQKTIQIQADRDFIFSERHY